MKLSDFLHSKGISYNAYNTNERNNYFSNYALENKIKFHLIVCEGQELLIYTYSDFKFIPSNNPSIEQILNREFICADFQGDDLSKNEVIDLLKSVKEDNLQMEVKDIQTSLEYFLAR